MAHRVFWFASVYFTAFVGCAFSSPRRTTGDNQQNDISETATMDKLEIPAEKDSQAISQETGNSTKFERDRGGGNNTDNGTSSRNTSSDHQNGTYSSEENNHFSNLTENDNKDVIEDTDFSNSNGSSNQTGSTRCPHCKSREKIKKYLELRQLEYVKKQILQKLHFESVPVFSGPKPNLPLQQLVNEYVLDEGILEKETDHTEDHYYAKNVKLFVMGNDVTHKCRRKRSAGCYFFDVEGKVSPEEVHSAELWIYKLFNRNDPFSQTFLLSELGQGINNRRTPKRDVKRVETTLKYGWLKIPLKRTLLHWLMKPHRNYGLTILCKFCQRKNHRTIFSSKSDSKPFLVINTRKHPPKRQIRSIPTRCTEQSTECCLAPLDINFREIGWSWVTAPSSFRANYCTGSCHEQYAAHYNHTQLIQEYRWSPAGHAKMTDVTPCCSPISFAPQSILYVDANRAIRVAKIPNISATACGCI